MLGGENGYSCVQICRRGTELRDPLLGVMDLAGNLLATLAESGYGMVRHAAKVGRRPSDFLGRLRHNTGNLAWDRVPAQPQCRDPHAGCWAPHLAATDA